MDTPTEVERRKILNSSGKGSGNGTSGSGTWTTKLRGILALLTVAFLVTISRISVQALNNAIPDFQLNAMRSFTAMVCYYMLFNGKSSIVIHPVVL